MSGSSWLLVCLQPSTHCLRTLRILSLSSAESFGVPMCMSRSRKKAIWTFNSPITWKKRMKVVRKVIFSILLMRLQGKTSLEFDEEESEIPFFRLPPTRLLWEQLNSIHLPQHNTHIELLNTNCASIHPLKIFVLSFVPSPVPFPPRAVPPTHSGQPDQDKGTKCLSRRN